mgnify:CR=1 FL=1
MATKRENNSPKALQDCHVLLGWVIPQAAKTLTTLLLMYRI